MSILLNRPQVIALYSLTMVIDIKASIEIASQDETTGNVVINVMNVGLIQQYYLHLYGGYSLVSTMVH